MFYIKFSNVFEVIFKGGKTDDDDQLEGTSGVSSYWSDSWKESSLLGRLHRSQN